MAIAQPPSIRADNEAAQSTGRENLYLHLEAEGAMSLMEHSIGTAHIFKSRLLRTRENGARDDPRKRIAGAAVAINGFTVVCFLRGGAPEQARQRLKRMTFAEAHRPKQVEKVETYEEKIKDPKTKSEKRVKLKRTKILEIEGRVDAFMAHIDGTTLVLDCTRGEKPRLKAIRKGFRYFKHYGGGVPWQRIKLGELKPDDAFAPLVGDELPEDTIIPDTAKLFSRDGEEDDDVAVAEGLEVEENSDERAGNAAAEVARESSQDFAAGKGTRRDHGDTTATDVVAGSDRQDDLGSNSPGDVSASIETDAGGAPNADDLFAKALLNLSPKALQFYARPDEIDKLVAHEGQKSKPDWHRLIGLVEKGARTDPYRWLGIERGEAAHLLAADIGYATDCLNNWRAVFVLAHDKAEQVKRLVDAEMKKCGWSGVEGQGGNWSAVDAAFARIDNLDLSVVKSFAELDRKERETELTRVMRLIDEAATVLDEIAVIDKSPIEGAPEDVVDILSKGMTDLRCSIRELVEVH